MQWRSSSLSGKWWSNDCQKESGSKRSSSGSMSGEMQNCNKTHGSPLWTSECFLDAKENISSEYWVCNADVSRQIIKWLLARNSHTLVGWQTKAVQHFGICPFRLESESAEQTFLPTLSQSLLEIIVQM